MSLLMIFVVSGSLYDDIISHDYQSFVQCLIAGVWLVSPDLLLVSHITIIVVRDN